MARKIGRGRNKVNATGRNEKPLERFARIPHRILLSEAFRSLDPTARCLLIELTMIESGKNNGSLWLSIRDAADRLGITDARPVMRAFDDLQDRGFTVMTKEAHFSIKASETSRARCWALTWLSWGGKPASNAWEKYVAPPASKARRFADMGLRAMARFRKALAAHKLPVVDFTAEGPKPALCPTRAAGNITTAKAA